MDDRAIPIEDEYPDEDRFVIIGEDAASQVLVVVFTFRGEDIRIISARKANSLERQEYEEWK